MLHAVQYEEDAALWLEDKKRGRTELMLSVSRLAIGRWMRLGREPRESSRPFRYAGRLESAPASSATAAVQRLGLAH